MAHRCVLVLLDGLGDRSYPFLNNQTPLQAAHTPNLDKLASIGANGLFHAERPGLALPSENAHFAMFGYEPEEFPGRGYLEALGAGIDVGYDEVALLTHFVTLREEGGLHVERHRPSVSDEETEALIEAVRDFSTAEINVRFHHTRALDGVLALRGDVSDQITDTDPLQTSCPMIAAGVRRGAEDWRAADKTAWALTAYLSHCYRVLDSHEVNRKRRAQGLPLINGLVTQRAGRRKDVESFSRRWGLKGLSISSGMIYWGLAAYLGMEAAKVTDSNNPGADLARRLEMAFAPESEQYQFAHVHTKTPDAAAHTKDARNKVEVIESLDAGLAPIMARLGDPDTVFVITADHSTPSTGPLIHSGESVPILVVGPGARRDAVKHFDEIACAGGALGNPRGRDLMPMVLNMLDMAKLRGIMDTIDDQPYWPGRRAPFKLQSNVTETDKEK